MESSIHGVDYSTSVSTFTKNCENRVIISHLQNN